MTTKKVNEEMETQDVKTTSVEQENVNLRKEVDELKEMVKQLLSAQSTKFEDERKSTQVETKEDNDDLYADIEEELNISPQRLVKIVSLVNGFLNLRGNGREPIHLREFGWSTKVTFEDLRAILNNHYELARQGAFFIQDRKAVKALYLEDDYENMLNADKIDKLIDLPAKEIISTLKSVPKLMKATIIQRIIKGIPSGDNRYTDWNKIKAISDYVGEDLMELAKNIEG